MIKAFLSPNLLCDVNHEFEERIKVERYIFITDNALVPTKQETLKTNFDYAASAA